MRLDGDPYEACRYCHQQIAIFDDAWLHRDERTVECTSGAVRHKARP